MISHVLAVRDRDGHAEFLASNDEPRGHDVAFLRVFRRGGAGADTLEDGTETRAGRLPGLPGFLEATKLNAADAMVEYAVETAR